MQFNSSKSRKSYLNRKAFKYSSILQTYQEPPTDIISLIDFEKFALDRIKLLKAIENAGLKHSKNSQDYYLAIKKEITNLKIQGLPLRLQDDTNADNIDEVMKRDHISHFILRLAFCKTEDLRRWFLAQEVELFRLRWSLMSSEAQKEFMIKNNFNYKPISEEEKEEKLTHLAMSNFRQNSNKSNIAIAQNVDFYKVHFIEAIELVRNRKVYIEKGFAYIASQDVVILIQNQFRMNLSLALILTTKALPYLAEDERLGPILEICASRHVSIDYVSNSNTDGEITPEMLDVLSKQSFPPCMQQLHHHLKQENHLKHNGRMQYGLFLKGIGLSVSDSLRFWKSEFSKKMDPDKFDKQYAYNIRHNYGQEGKRVNYTPYSCMKICSSTPAPGDIQGCPFRHSDPSILRQRLQTVSNNTLAIEQIVDLAKKGHPQLSCGKYFDLEHGTDTGFTPNHPNQYFDESRNIYKLKNNVKADETSKVQPKLVRLSQVNNDKTISSKVNIEDEFDDDFDESAMMNIDLESATS